MKVLSIKQPWADMIAAGQKTLEVRSWSTSYRGPLLVASCAQPERNEYAARWPAAPRDRLGITVCIVDLVDVREGRASDAKAAGGFNPTGYFVWQLANPRRVAANQFKGSLGIRDVGPETMRAISR